jgi:hypothetical protein
MMLGLLWTSVCMVAEGAGFDERGGGIGLIFLACA